MAYASVQDVAIDYDGDLSDDATVDKVMTLIERAEGRIRQEYRDLDIRIEDGRTSLALVKQVESEMVASVLRNPGGYTNQSTSNTNGPFSESISGTLSTTAASGLLRLTRAHRELLGDRAGAVSAVSAGGHPPHAYGYVRSPYQFVPPWRRRGQW